MGKLVGKIISLVLALAIIGGVVYIAFFEKKVPNKMIESKVTLLTTSALCENITELSESDDDSLTKILGLRSVTSVMETYTYTYAEGEEEVLTKKESSKLEIQNDGKMAVFNYLVDDYNDNYTLKKETPQAQYEIMTDGEKMYRKNEDGEYEEIDEMTFYLSLAIALMGLPMEEVDGVYELTDIYVVREHFTKATQKGFDIKLYGKIDNEEVVLTYNLLRKDVVKYDITRVSQNLLTGKFTKTVSHYEITYPIIKNLADSIVKKLSEQQ